MPIKVSIIEDDAEARQIFAQWISKEPEFQLLSEHGSVEEALEVLPTNKPQIVLSDINLPGMSGAEGVAHLKAVLPETNFVMFTVYEDVDHIFKALSNGASGYLLKHTPRPELIQALKEVHAGGSPMSSKIARKVVQAFYRPPAAPQPAKAASAVSGDGSELAPRERELLELLAQGFLYKEIADRMQITVGTVNTYIRRIYEKLHVHSRSQAIAKLNQMKGR
jgi:DNA-binding NarL/FixJ family response regulator